MPVSNKEILTALCKDNGSLNEYIGDEVFEMGINDTGGTVYGILEAYPTIKNEFINTLTNRVIKTLFYSRVFENPLRMLHRGELPYGMSIEQIFVKMAEKINFGENFGKTQGVTGTSEAESLISKIASEVEVKYITRNFQYKYKVSISEELLRTAFMDANGLGEMIGQLIDSELSAAYFDEYLDMVKVITNLYEGKDFDGSALDGVTVPKHTLASTDPKALSVAIRGLAGRMKFPSDKYNMVGVTQWSKREDLILLTTPEVIAELDVNVLADAFNVSKAELNVRTIEVSSLPDGVKAVLMDKDFLQCWDTLMTTRTFENADQLVRNIFLHKQGIMSACLFANVVYIVDPA